jgi:colicin import membrane protein
MPGFVKEHLRPLAGSAGLHLVLIVLLAVAAFRWTSSRPPPAVAIEGYVTEAPASTSPPRNETPEQDRAVQTEQMRRDAETQAAKEQADRQAREQAAAEQQRIADAERQRVSEEAERKRIAEVERIAAQAEAERQAEAKRLAAEAEVKRQAEDEARKVAAAAEAKRKAEAEAAAAAEAKRKAEAKLAAERESALQRSLAAEEEAEAFAQSGAINEYRNVLTQAIQRNWNRPPSARPGLKCTLFVTQAPGGTVIDVRLGACNGDEAVRESITNAVYRTSPLPAPRDPRAFQRDLEIVFEPRE